MIDSQQLQHRDHRPAAARFPLRLLAQDIIDPLNVGSLFRLADALGVEHIHLTGTSVRPPHGKLRKAARATEQYVPWSYSADSLAVVNALKAQGYWVVALELTRKSIDVRTLIVPPECKILLLLGAEKDGLSEPMLEQSAQTVHIPMRGINSSMNVAVACALAVFELTKKLGQDSGAGGCAIHHCRMT